MSDLISVPRAAERLGRDVRTVRRWIAQGGLPTVRIGDRDYVSRAHLDAVVASARATSPREYRR